MIDFMNPNNTDHTTQKNTHIREMELLRALWIDENALTLTQRETLIDAVDAYREESEQPLEKAYGGIMQDIRSYTYSLQDTESEQYKALCNIIEKNKI
jgi:hypothetical protein